MRRLATIVGAILLATPGVVLAGDPGLAGATFLRVGLGARAAAMGDAYVAVAEDAATVYWNPGAMPAVLGTKTTLVHTEYFGSIRVEQAALTHETRWGTLGFSFTGLFMDDMERRDDFPTAVPLGEFGAYDVAFAVAYGRYIFPNLAAGISVKPVYERIDELSASGVAVDAGVYHVSRIRGVKLAATVGNVGPPMKFDVEEFALPRYVRVGASWDTEVAAIDGRVLIAVDGAFPNDGDPRQHIGAEYSYRRMLALRAGYKAGFSVQGASFGFGVAHRTLDFDYAFLPSEKLGDSHRFGLGFSF